MPASHREPTHHQGPTHGVVPEGGVGGASLHQLLVQGWSGTWPAKPSERLSCEQ